jgi:hypothetical protein
LFAPKTTAIFRRVRVSAPFLKQKFRISDTVTRLKPSLKTSEG